MNSTTYATSGNLAVENTRPSVQSVAHCTAAGRSSKARWLPAPPGWAHSLHHAHNRNTQLPHAVQCSGWRPGSCLLQQPGPRPMQAGMRGSAHKKTTLHTPAHKAHNSRVCATCVLPRCSAGPCRPHNVVCTYSARHTKASTPGRKNTRQKPCAQPMRATRARPTTPSLHAAKKGSEIPNKAGMQADRKVNILMRAVRVKWLEIQQKRPYTMELCCNSVCMLCRAACGQHRSRQQANTAAVKSRATDPA